MTIVTHGNVIKSDGDWNPAEKKEGKEKKTCPLAPLKHGGLQCRTRGGGAVTLVVNTSSAAHRNFPTVLYGMIRCAEVAVVKNARRNQPANVFSSLQIFAEQY